MIDRHYHWVFIAHQGEPMPEKIHWGVTVEVIGYLSEADARVAAADIVVRDQYALNKVWECAQCGFQQQTSASLAEMAKKA